MRNVFHTITSLEVASNTDRDKCVVELWSGDIQAVELNQQNGQALMEIYPRRDGKPWIFDLKQFQTKLDTAKTELEKNTVAPVAPVTPD